MKLRTEDSKRIVAGAAALAALILPVACATRDKPEWPRIAERDRVATSQPASPQDDYIATQAGQMAVEDQQRSAQPVDQPAPPPRHRDSPVRRPARSPRW